MSTRPNTYQVNRAIGDQARDFAARLCAGDRRAVERLKALAVKHYAGDRRATGALALVASAYRPMTAIVARGVPIDSFGASDMAASAHKMASDVSQFLSRLFGNAADVLRQVSTHASKPFDFLAVKLAHIKPYIPSVK